MLFRSDDIMTGVGVGRVIGDVGLITGVVWEHRLRDETDPVTHLNKSIEYRAPRFFLGFDLRS